VRDLPQEWCQPVELTARRGDWCGYLADIIRYNNKVEEQEVIFMRGIVKNFFDKNVVRTNIFGGSHNLVDVILFHFVG